MSKLILCDEMKKRDNLKHALTTKFKWSLNILRDKEQLTGDKALNAIAYLLILRLSEQQIIDNRIDIDNMEYYAPLMVDMIIERKLIEHVRFSNLYKFINENKDNECGLVQKFKDLRILVLSKHPKFKDLFNNSDDPFKIKYDNTFKLLINDYANFPFEDYEADIQGEAYEEVIKDMMTGKVLGQFFTPPIVKQFMVDLIKPKVYEDGTIETMFDPAMGTGGFLITTMRYLIQEANKKNIKLNYNFIGTKGLGGRETEPDTYRLAKANMLISSGHTFESLERGDSIRNPIKNKYDIVLANPPFGIKGLDYKSIENIGEIMIQDYIPIRSNSAIPLFLQTIIYILKINGKSATVVPNGQELFNKGNDLIALREYIMKTCELKEIFNLPSNVFTNTSIKTCVLYFEKKKEGVDVVKIKTNSTGKVTKYEFIKEHETKSVKFYDYDPYTKEKKLLIDAPIDIIAKNSYSLNYMDYMEKEEIKYGNDIQMKTLGEVCEFKNGKSITKEKCIPGQYSVIGGGKQSSYTHNEYNRNEKTILCSSSGANAGYISRYNDKVWASDCFSIQVKNKILDENYLYYYLINKQNNIYKLQTGTAQPHIYSSNLSEMKIPMPPINIQKKIIEQLDDIVENNKACENRIKKNDILSKQILENYLNNNQEKSNLISAEFQKEKDFIFKNTQLDDNVIEEKKKESDDIKIVKSIKKVIVRNNIKKVK